MDRLKKRQTVDRLEMDWTGWGRLENGRMDNGTEETGNGTDWRWKC